MNHLRAHNPDEHPDVQPNPFGSASEPAHLSEVPCEAPNCPFTTDEVNVIRARLVALVDTESKAMNVRRLVWEKALGICREIVDASANSVRFPTCLHIALTFHAG